MPQTITERPSVSRRRRVRRSLPPLPATTTGLRSLGQVLAESLPVVDPVSEPRPRLVVPTTPRAPFADVHLALRVLLMARGMSQADLARETGLTAPAVSSYLAGRRVPTLGNLGRMLDGLGATAADLAEAMGEQHRVLVPLREVRRLLGRLDARLAELERWR